MNQTSSVVTGSATAAAVALAPFIDWLANTVFKLAMPQQVVLIVAAGMVTAGHFIVNFANAVIAKKRDAAALPKSSGDA